MEKLETENTSKLNRKRYTKRLRDWTEKDLDRPQIGQTEKHQPKTV